MKKLSVILFLATALAACTSKQKAQDEKDSAQAEHLADSMMRDTLDADGAEVTPLSDSADFRKPLEEKHK